MSRRLAAILVADVVGYSRLMGADEGGTLAVIQDRWRAIVEPVVGEHGGRVVKFMGDGVLAEFPSAVNAVISARALQEQFASANESMATDSRILLRIGINLGDVISEGSDIFGDGVNVAARLEALAEPGGICISAKVHEELTGKLDLAIVDLGELQLKNIAKPVRAFKLWTGAGAPPPPVASAAVDAAGDQPSIAVLPFANMSADPDQEYFSDGITEDIITDLSKIAGLLVIARNSSFAYKNKSPDIRVVGRELGVRSVLEGSIRRAGNRVRITAQLIDAASGGHLWAERYDRDLTDIFELQDEVTRRIVEALKVTLAPAEKVLLEETRRTNIEAHDCFLRGRELLLSAKKNRELFDQMVGAFERAIELDPGYAEAYAGFAMAYALDFQNHWSDTPDPLALAARFTAQALEKGPNESYVHYVASVVAMWQKDLARSKAEAEAALALNANFARAYGVLGLVEVYLGSPLAAIPYIERARRLDPVMTHQYLHFLGSAYLVAGQYEAAAATFRERIRLSPETDLSRALLASALGHLGEFEEARQVWQDLRTVNPKYSFADHLSRLPIQNPADAERIRTGVLKAGLLDPVPAEAPPPT
jgi:adenylate cyclase